MSNTSLRLDTRRPLKDGTYPVQIKVGYGTNLYISTGIYIKPCDWNEYLQICTVLGASKINSILAAKLLQVNNKVLELKQSGQFYQLTASQLRQALTGQVLTQPAAHKVPSVGEYFDKVIALKSGKTQISYDQTRKRLSDYCGDLYDLQFTDLDYSFFEGWLNKMALYKRNTVSRRVKDLKAVIRYAREDGIEVNQAYLKVDSRGDDDTPMRVLPLKTMRHLMQMELDKRYSMYRDAFVLTFLLVGINFADLKKLTRENVVNGRIQYRRSKTGKNYSIKIEPEAKAIIDRYPGQNYLLNFQEKYKYFEQNCNKFLNSFQKGVTLYWARYSWANYAVDLDIPKDTISEALGHRHGAPITGVYIRYSNDKIDAANRAVIDYVSGKVKKRRR